MPNRSGKGASFERSLCVRLSEWWTQDLDVPRSDIYWRTDNSGARATTRSKKGLSTFGSYGDITATDPIGQPLLDLVTIEAKRGYSKDSIHDVIDRSSSAAEQTYEKWFNQARKSAKGAQSISWMLITKRDRREPLVFLPADNFDLTSVLFAESCCPFSIATFYDAKGEQEIDIYLLEEFLKDVKPSPIINAMKKRKHQ